MAPGDLQEVLEALKPAGRAQPDLLVGLAAADDAAVYRITSDFAIVETVDFFPPVVDDPWTWGAISAANSMSDVFAMGGEVLFALAVAGFPREMSKAIIAEVFRGGSDKIVEAGGVIAGGHTVVDNERSEEHTSELQSLAYLVCRLLLEKKKKIHQIHYIMHRAPS